MGAAIAITRTDHTSAQLRRLAGQCRDGTQVRRLLAIAMVLAGSPRTEAAQQNGMDRQTLGDWVHRYNRMGVAGLKSRSGPGPKPVLTEAQMAELREWVLKGPGPAIHTVVRWRCVDLRAEVKRRFEVTAHESTIGKWLRQLKMTRLQPRPQHPQKDPDAETAFKKLRDLGKPHPARLGRRQAGRGLVPGRSSRGAAGDVGVYLGAGWFAASSDAGQPS